MQYAAITVFGLLLGLFICMNPAIANHNSESKENVHILLDGQEQTFNASPVIIDGTTLVPMRQLFETFALDVRWEAETQSVTGAKEGISIRMQIDNPTVHINHQPTELRVAPQLINSVTMVPIRIVSETLHLEVDWDGKTNTVILSSTKYEGPLFHGKAQGMGKLYQWSELVYEGEFQQGEYQGQGKTFYAGGKLMYEGSFHHGTMHGQGKMYKEDGSLWYDASFENGSIQGAGTVYFPLGHRLEVNFIDGNPDGEGTYYYGDGTVRFIGEYRNGFRNGSGIEFYPNGEISYDGEYINSLLVSGKLYYEDGTLWYEGGFNGYMPHGQGVEYHPDGTISQQGEFKDGQLIEEE